MHEILSMVKRINETMAELNEASTPRERGVLLVTLAGRAESLMHMARSKEIKMAYEERHGQHP